MQEFLSVLGEFFSKLAMFVTIGAEYLFKILSKWFKAIISSIDIPLLPSKSRILTYTYVSGTLLALFLIYVFFINIKTYSLFAEDKRLAEEEEFRIKESRLLKYCFFGGALGGFFGMKKARHKTRKPLFYIGVRVMLIIQVMLFSFVCGFFGFWLYMS